MHPYIIKLAFELSPSDVAQIIHIWAIEAWKNLSIEVFKEKFSGSEFHLLYVDYENIASIARINFDFKIMFDNETFNIPEFVGFASVTPKLGYGSRLLYHIIDNLKARNLESVGFCKKELRVFYEKMQVEILYNKAKFLREKEESISAWAVPEDDDMLNLNLSAQTLKMIACLREGAFGYL